MRHVLDIGTAGSTKKSNKGFKPVKKYRRINKHLKNQINAWWEVNDSDKRGYIFISDLIKKAKLDLIKQFRGVIGEDEVEILTNYSAEKSYKYIDPLRVKRNKFREEQREILKTMREGIKK